MLTVNLASAGVNDSIEFGDTTENNYEVDTLLFGVWTKHKNATQGLRFNKDGTMEAISFKNPIQKTMPGEVRYRTYEKDSVSYIEFNVYKNNELIMTSIDKYKIEDGFLYLPVRRTDNMTGKVTILEYESKYFRKEE